MSSNDSVRSPQSLNPLSQHSAPHTPEVPVLSEVEGFFGAASPSSLHAFYCLHHHHAGFGSLLARLREYTLTRRQASLNVADCGVVTLAPHASARCDIASVFGSLLDRMVTTGLLGHYPDWSCTS